MPTEIGQGILGLSPDWLKFGALGLLAIAIIVVAAVVFSGARNQSQFRLALLFMGFTLIVAALAIGAEIYRDNTTLDRLVAERDAALGRAAQAETVQAAVVAAKEAAEADARAAVAEMTTMAMSVKGEIGTLAALLDAKFCLEIDQMGNSAMRDSLAFLVERMRNGIRNIHATIGIEVPAAAIPAECVRLGGP